MAAKKKPTVAIVMGSKTDWPVLEFTVKTLKEFGVESTVRVMSAHRTPHEAVEFAENASKNGYKVIIGAAGGAAHLCGVLAGHTTLPVVGIPVKGWALDGMDSLLSTVQMPKGVPVATVAIGILAKTVPQVNILQMGFALRIALGVLCLIVFMPVLGLQMHELFTCLRDEVFRTLSFM